MTQIRFAGAFLAAAVVMTGVAASTAHAMTAQECYNAFRTERKTGDLKNMDYQDYKSARCALDAKATAGKASASAASAQPAQTSQAPAPVAAAPAASAPTTSTPTPAAPTSRASNAVQGSAVFPSAVAAQYANLKPGRARMQTCLDQYRANKANNGNGGLRWIQKGGGYYSECNRHLKQ